MQNAMCFISSQAPKSIDSNCLPFDLQIASHEFFFFKVDSNWPSNFKNITELSPILSSDPLVPKLPQLAINYN